MQIKGAGITGFGAAIPRRRIKTSEIAKAWGKPESTGKSLGIEEKAVAAIDQDTVGLAVDAAELALSRAGVAADWVVVTDNKESRYSPNIGAVYTGSESHPYAVKSTSAIVGEALGVGNDYTAADLEFACKAGTASLQVVAGLAVAGMIEAGIAIGADVSQSRPGDALEYSAAAAGAAFLVTGKKSKESWLAELTYTTSFTSDTPDFWRREHQIYPSHGGRFTGEPAYFKHIGANLEQILAESKSKISDFAHVVLHMPNGRFPQTVAKKFGISAKQLEAGFVVPQLGNSYSACSMVGLVAALEASRKGERILVCSYGSGSGSDAFVIEAVQDIKSLWGSAKLKEFAEMSVQNQIKDKVYVGYTEYMRNLDKIKI